MSSTTYAYRSWSVYNQIISVKRVCTELQSRAAYPNSLAAHLDEGACRICKERQRRKNWGKDMVLVKHRGFRVNKHSMGHSEYVCSETGTIPFLSDPTFLWLDLPYNRTWLSLWRAWSSASDAFLALRRCDVVRRERETFRFVSVNILQVYQQILGGRKCWHVYMAFAQFLHARRIVLVSSVGKSARPRLDHRVSWVGILCL